jgi:hypothetical protein
MATYIFNHVSAASVALASGATEVHTASKQVHIPRITAAGTTGWYGELDPIAPSGPDGDDLVLTPRKVAALCRLANEAVNDSNPRVLDVVGASMSGRSRSRRTERSLPGPAADDQPLASSASHGQRDAESSFAGIAGRGRVRARRRRNAGRGLS